MEQVNANPTLGAYLHEDSVNRAFNNHSSSTDTKTKSEAAKIFDWLNKNKTDIAGAVFAVVFIGVTIPLVATGLLLLPEVLPIISVASLIFGAGIFNIVCRARYERKINISCNNLEQVIKRLVVYKRQLPTEKEIDETTSLQDLIDVTERWVNSHTELRKELEDKKIRLVSSLEPLYLVDGYLQNMKDKLNERGPHPINSRANSIEKMHERYSKLLKNYLTTVTQPNTNNLISITRVRIQDLKNRL